MAISTKQAQLTVQKLRHPVKARLLQVRRKAQITPYLVRVTLTGDDLDGFVSPSFDDHVRLFLPPVPGEKPVMPTVSEQGLVYPEGQPRPVLRDYTPRRYDSEAGELDIDFVLHGHNGRAASWASAAHEGHYVGIGGPRGSFVIPCDYAWHLLVGDETAMPAIGRRLAELPRGKRVLAIIETEHPNARLNFETRADVTLQWVQGVAGQADGMSPLERVIHRLQLPDGDGYVWAAGEHSSIRAIHQHLVNERGLDKSRIRAVSYWRHTAGEGHEVFGD
ncbi:MAG: siderophore-interacting protein [Burkholderiaceae bacterium]|nr:MAG: siderophore-interacting protein [Burkholderiaceae bacterium]TAM08609.1 MAG: siderophore-interacting protein [Pusillimonas sp.]